jgi:outer membrane protein TolC
MSLADSTSLLRPLLPAALALALASAPAFAQTTPVAPPRPPGEIGPTPTNPLDTGLGTTTGAGSAPTQGSTVTVPTVPSVTPPTTSAPVVARLPAVPSTTTTQLVPPRTQALVPPPANPPPIPPVFQPTPGGLTAEGAAQRALRSSYAVEAARQGLLAAQAQQAETGRAMIPNVALSARYTRLSEYPPATFTNPFNPSMPIQIQPAILDQYALRASVTIPLTDIPLRLLQFYRAAGLTAEARQIEIDTARAQVGLQAREAYYEYVRARGQLIAAERSLEATRARREDVARFVAAGTLARAELLRMDVAVARAEQGVTQARNGVAVSESLLRQRLHMDNAEPITIGEALEEPVLVPGNVTELVQRAWTNRPELLSIDRQVRALDATIAGNRASYFPSIAAVGNFDYANPNSRIFPQRAEFRETWDATIQLSWSPIQAFGAEATVSRLQAQRAQAMAQAAQLREGVEAEVRVYWSQARGAEAQIAAARASLLSAQENYRIQRERLATGAAVVTEVAQAETELLSAYLSVIDAHINLRLALARLRRASGEREAGR